MLFNNTYTFGSYTMLKKLFIFILLAACLGSAFFVFKELKNKTHKNTPILTTVPRNSAAIFKVENPTNFWRNLSETNLIWNHLKTNNKLAQLDANLNIIDSIIHLAINDKNRETVISIQKSNSNIPDISLAFVANEAEYKNLIQFFEVEFSKKENTFLSSFSHQYLSPFILISTNNNLLKKSSTQISKNESLLQDSTFMELYKHEKSNTQLFINPQKVKEIASPYFKKKFIESWNQDKNWNSFDFILSNDKVLLNGLSNLKTTNPVLNTRNIEEAILPNYINSKTEYAIDTDNVPENILSTITSVCNCTYNESVKELLGDKISKVEFGKNNHSVYYLDLQESEEAVNKLRTLLPTDSTSVISYNHTLFKLKNSSLNTLLNINVPIYITFLDSYLVVSTKEGLKQLTYEWKRNEHTKPKYYYNDFSKDYLAQKSNYSFYSTFNILSNKTAAVLKPEYLNIYNTNISAIEDNFHIAYQRNSLSPTINHEAFILKTLYSKDNKNGKIWSLTFDTPSIRNPQLLKNHRSKSLDIIIQDQNNVIHLINAAGNIKWSKKMDAPIIGNVEQIDIYGNNKYQMVFNTRNKIHVLDINGNTVTGFPITLDSPATSPITIFDYDNNQNYRFWVSCENYITYNYDKEGKKVMGWTNPKSNSIIKQKYQRTIFSQKDYIYTLTNDGSLIILNRRGENIKEVSQKIKAQNNLITLQRRATLASSSFIYIDDSTNKLTEYSFNNVFKEINLDTNNTIQTVRVLDIDNNKFTDYITFNQNKIEVYGLDQTLVHKNEFIENIENAVIVNNKHTNKYYISIQKEDSDEIIILDNNLNILSNSMIKGDKNIAIGDINSNGALEIITLSNNQTIQAYSINP